MAVLGGDQPHFEAVGTVQPPVCSSSHKAGDTGQAPGLSRAIFRVINGETYIQPSMIPLLNSKMIERDIEKIKIKALTKRELEVLKLLSIGLYNKEIGERLSISERTVKNHISSIFKKIEVTDRTQAAVFSIRNKIVNVF